MIRRSHAWGVVALSILTACVLPARDVDDYEGKAVSSAESAASHVGTAILAAEAVDRDALQAPIVAVILGDAEVGAVSVRDTFASIQPPDPPSDALRVELLPLLDEVAASLAELRIAARRDDHDEVVRLAAPLHELADRLESFAQEHERP